MTEFFTPSVSWAQGYLPINCICGRRRLMYELDGNAVIRVRCEKCNRDSTDSVWTFDNTGNFSDWE